MDTNLTALVGKAVEQALARHVEGANLNTLLIALIGLVGVVSVALLAGFVNVKVARIMALANESKTIATSAVAGISHVKEIVNSERSAMVAKITELRNELVAMGFSTGLATSQSPANEALQKQLQELQDAHQELKRSKQSDDAKAEKLERSQLADKEAAEDLRHSRMVDDARAAKLLRSAALLNELMLANQ